MDTSKELQSSLKSLFNKAFSHIKNDSKIALSDIYLGFDTDECQFSFYDDDERLLLQLNLDNGVCESNEREFVQPAFSQLIRDVLTEDDIKKQLETMDIIKPFSVMLVNDGFYDAEELICLDDDAIVLHDDFISYLDKELDLFLKQLLQDL